MELVEIHVRGHIAKDWSDWLGGLTITNTQHGETVFSGAVRDQAALRGLLDTIADLGLQLSSVASAREVVSTRQVASTHERRASDAA
jgi:hypothetical protein